MVYGQVIWYGANIPPCGMYLRLIAPYVFLLTNTGKNSGNDENNTDNVSTITSFYTELEFRRNFVLYEIQEHEISVSQQIRCDYDGKESRPEFVLLYITDEIFHYCIINLTWYLGAR